MKKLLVLVSMLGFGFTATAGVGGYQGTTSLGLVEYIKCSTGLTCSKVGNKLNMVVSPGQSNSPLVLATATTITSTQCGQTFYNGGAVIMNLPEASTVLGCNLTFSVLNASAFNINPDNADIILNSTNIAGDSSINSTVGGSITLRAVSASQWAVVGINGTWTDGN